MIGSIISFLGAIPKILDLIATIGQWIAKNEINVWMDDCSKAFDGLNQAKTPEDKQKAAATMVDLIHRLNK